MDEPTSPVVAVPEEPTRRSGGAFKGVLLLIVLAALLAAAWWWWVARGTHSADDAQTAASLDTQVESLMHSVSQLRSATDTLRARLDDGDKVDHSLRDQFIALGERTRLLEDAVGNLANKRLSGHDSLALDEAELLLTLGGERFNLFRDPAGAIAADRAADTALGEVEDAAFSTVRQSINAEIAALSGLQSADPTLLVDQLGQLRARIVQLPTTRHLADAAPEQNPSRLMRVLGALVQVHHDEAPGAAVTDASLALQLAALDLRDAQAAALARDDAHFKAAVIAARTQINTAFDPDSAEVAATLKQLDALAAAPLAPTPPPILGTSLKELRNLRAAHALRASTGTAIPPEAFKAEGTKP